MNSTAELRQTKARRCGLCLAAMHVASLASYPVKATPRAAATRVACQKACSGVAVPRFAYACSVAELEIEFNGAAGQRCDEWSPCDARLWQIVTRAQTRDMRSISFRTAGRFFFDKRNAGRRLASEPFSSGLRTRSVAPTRSRMNAKCAWL